MARVTLQTIADGGRDAFYLGHIAHVIGDYFKANGGFLSDATQFFTNSTAISLTKRKLRYSVARWGYSTAVMSWAGAVRRTVQP